MTSLFRFMNWPLRAKMATFLVVVSLLPLVVASWIDIRGVRARLLESATSLLAARADQLVGSLDTFNRGYQRSVSEYALLPGVVAFCGAAPSDRNRLEQAILGDLEAQPASDANIRGAAILDVAGTVSVATEPQLVGNDLSFHKYVRQALTGAAIISDIHLAEPALNSEPTITYLAPVLGADGSVRGLVVLWVRATSLWELMKASNELAGPGSFGVLYDHEGVRVAHTHNSDIVFHPGGSLVPALVEALVREHRFGDRTRALLDDVRPFPEQFARARAEKLAPEAFRGFAPADETWIYGVGRRFETIPWTLFYMIPEESLDAPITKITREKILFAALVIVIALAAGTLFMGVILKPVRALSRVTEALGSGDLAARVQFVHSDEIGRLGTSFNAMADRIEGQALALQSANEELESRVQARTAQLVQTTKDLELEVVERRRAEEAFKKLNETLEQHVVQRTTQLEAANKELESFAYSVSHDLRGPLRSLDGFSQALLEDYADKLDDEGKDYLRRIRGASQRMGSLIDDLLDLSRLSRQEMHRHRVDITAMARMVVSELREQEPQRDVAVEIAEGLAADGDPALLQSVFQNLVGNAWKFTRHAAHARIAVGAQQEDGEQVFFVRDNGAGFDMAYADKLFGAFQRLHAMTEFEGNGVGLATVQRIVRRHGGRIWANAVVNQGATFYFTLQEKKDSKNG